jgi:phosphonate transport system substrate-binding protein
LVCSKVERAGGTVVGQFLREGLLTYRAALVCAKAAPLELKSMRGVRAVWVDKDSAAGYLLPIVHLNRLGVEPGKVFVSQTFAGSLSLALEAVSQGKADLTAVYSRPAQAKTPHTGLDDAPLAIRDRLQIIGYTDEAPNDGIVIASSVPRETVDVLRPRLLSSMREPSAGYMLAQVFNAESLEPAVQGSYSALVRLVTQPK